jgi:hypothetical protein
MKGNFGQKRNFHAFFDEPLRYGYREDEQKNRDLRNQPDFGGAFLFLTHFLHPICFIDWSITALFGKIVFFVFCFYFFYAQKNIILPSIFSWACYN